MEVVDLKEVKSSAVALTRREKLLRWADLIRQQPRNLYIFHRLEHWAASRMAMSMWDMWGGDTPRPNAFTIAKADPAFQAAGLQGDSAIEIVKFFELTKDELHEFSCDCGGEITNKTMADRVTRLAGPATVTGFIGRLLYN